MRILAALLSLFLLVNCQPKSNSNQPATPPPTVEERIGIYRNATIYTGRSDYEFEIDGKRILVRISNLDTLNQPEIPTNLTVPTADGIPKANPLLLGSKYKLSFGPQEMLKSIELIEAHDPSSTEVPAIPTDYSGLLAVAPEETSRAYLKLYADLTAILLISYEAGQEPVYRVGRWTRTNGGQHVSTNFNGEEWRFLVRENALVLISRQMGTAGLSLVATENPNMCDYVHQWLSDLSTTDDERRVPVTAISNETPLSEVLRTEHAYMGLYGTLETVFLADEKTISTTLRANPTVQSICDILLQNIAGEGH